MQLRQKREQVYISRFSYINLFICYFCFSFFFPMDLSYLVLFSIYFQCSFVLTFFLFNILSNILQYTVYMLQDQNTRQIYKHLKSSKKKKKKKYTIILPFIIMYIITFTNAFYVFSPFGFKLLSAFFCFQPEEFPLVFCIKQIG